METVWDTRPFNSMWPTDGSQPFVFSMGDPTGFGHHGDYVFGWEGDSLQRAMDTCTDIGGNPPSCRALTVISDAEINRCTQSVQVNERTTGYLPALPGCNPIQPGPAQATMPASCDAVSTTGGVGGSVPTAPPAPGTTQVPPAPSPCHPLPCPVAPHLPLVHPSLTPHPSSALPSPPSSALRSRPLPCGLADLTVSPRQ
ncbi:hypothetical protein NLJ89_g12097 [Agrocybe chaxingu]|uniref:DUF1996 domain-containing protein n=1 Tax=Agrocybe chaxingu TaxID=84603 RepID=A0A9W8JKN2_9AGAR|nr:hypothetical protein NLJ89_g12097 [Agrocybe chaxingu]